MGETAKARPSTTVNLGAAFRPDGTCYGCGHDEKPHVNGDLLCDCCMAEHVRRKHGVPVESAHYEENL